MLDRLRGLGHRRTSLAIPIGPQHISGGPFVFAAGQFVVPLFEGDRVPYFLLTEINVQLETYNEVSLLSNNKPHVRATVLETLFELERRGDVRPGTLDPETIKAAVKEDLERTFNLTGVRAIFLDRLLLQETSQS